MQCTRCAGLRVPEIIYEGGSRVLALRCVYCGAVIDHGSSLTVNAASIQNQAEAECPSNVQA